MFVQCEHAHTFAYNACTLAYMCTYVCTYNVCAYTYTNAYMHTHYTYVRMYYTETHRMYILLHLFMHVQYMINMYIIS